MSFHDAGLRFECQRCGRCCRGPGNVWVTELEIERIAGGLGLSRSDFGRRYLRLVHDRISLVDGPSGDCVFYDARRGCTVYSDRPTQCRTFPFWPRLLETEAAWKEAGASCLGIGQGRLFTKDEVEAIARGESV